MGDFFSEGGGTLPQNRTPISSAVRYTQTVTQKNILLLLYKVLENQSLSHLKYSFKN